jgi:hypothetical protein
MLPSFALWSTYVQCNTSNLPCPIWWLKASTDGGHSQNEGMNLTTTQESKPPNFENGPPSKGNASPYNISLLRSRHNAIFMRSHVQLHDGHLFRSIKNCIYLHKLQWSTNDTRVPTLAIKHLIIIIIIASLVLGVGGGPSLTHLI